MNNNVAVSLDTEEMDDYEQCGDCGYDHAYEYAEAKAWHEGHPCSYCHFDKVTNQHELDCCTLDVIEKNN